MKSKILKQIIIIFSVCSLVVVLTIVYICNLISKQSSIEHTSSITSNAMDLFTEYVKDDNFPSCLEDPDMYEAELNDLTMICKMFKLRYMYVFTINEQLDERTFYLIAANDDEEDRKVKEEFSYGTKRDAPRINEISVFLGLEESSYFLEDNAYGCVYAWCYPVKDDDGRIVAIVGMDYDVSKIQSRGNHEVLRIMLPILFTFVFVSLGLILLFHREVFHPLRLLAERMEQYSPETGFRSSEIRAVGELRAICDSFEKMSDTIQTYITDIQKITEEKLQTDVELDVARRIQYGMVPHDFSLSDDTFAADAFAEAAKEVGGDFYDCFTENGKVYAVIGDVSGKGIAAALFMSMAKNIIHEKLCAGKSPAETFISVNHELYMQNPEGMFITAFAAILDTDTGELCYANAGHTYPVLLSDPCRRLEPQEGILLGLFDDADITDEVMLLKEQEGILLYTDGATEAVNADHAFFGEERLLAAVSGNPENAAHAAANAVREFDKGQEKFDDLTLLSVVRKQNGTCITMELPPSIDAFDEVRDGIMTLVGLTPQTKQVLLACEEIFVNIVEYSGTETVHVLCAVQQNRLVLRFEDSGQAFDPISTKLPEKEFDDLDTGGMGIALVRQIASEQEYKYAGGKNILKLVFELTA